MRLRTFVAPSMAEVMQEVRAVLGGDAIIVSTLTQDDGRVRVTAALEQEDVFDDILDDAPEPAPSETLDVLGQVLTYHGVPLDLSSRLLGIAACIAVDDPVMRFAAVLDDIYRFWPLQTGQAGGPVMIVGPPGVGKSVTTAKLAARATLSGASVSVITIDTNRAAASDQLAAFTRIMGIELKTAETPAELRFALGAGGRDRAVFIDSEGINPFDYDEIARLVEFVEVCEIDTALVLSAGMDALEAADIADAFRVLRPGRVITTRIDMARRLGGMLTAADVGGVAFADVGIAPQIAGGLTGLTPVSLAKLLMRDPLSLDLEFQNTEAAE